MMQPESEQPEARRRVLDCLTAAGAQGISSHELCIQANTHAAVRRVWELSVHYGYVIIGSKEARYCWRWKFVRAEPWALDPDTTVREAKTAEKSRLEALAHATAPKHAPSAPGQIGLGI